MDFGGEESSFVEERFDDMPTPEPRRQPAPTGVKKQPQSLQEMMLARKKPPQPPQPPRPRPPSPKQPLFDEYADDYNNRTQYESYGQSMPPQTGAGECDDENFAVGPSGATVASAQEQELAYAALDNATTTMIAGGGGGGGSDLEEEMPSSANFVYADADSDLTAIFSGETSPMRPVAVSSSSAAAAHSPTSLNQSLPSQSVSHLQASSAVTAESSSDQLLEKEREKLGREFEIMTMALNGDNRAKAEQIDRLRAELRDANDRVMQLEQKYTALLSRADNEGTLKANIADLVLEREKAEEKLDKASEDALHWKSEAGNCKVELNKMKMELSRSKAELGAKNTECEELRATADALRQQLQEAVELEQGRKRDASSRTEMQLDSLRIELEDANRANNRLNSDVAALESSMAALAADKTALQQRLTHAEDIARTSGDEAEVALRRLQALDREVQQLTAENSALKVKVASAQQQQQQQQFENPYAMRAGGGATADRPRKKKPDDGIDLSQWREKGFLNEFSYAKSLGLLDRSNDPPSRHPVITGPVVVPPSYQEKNTRSSNSIFPSSDDQRGSRSSSSNRDSVGARLLPPSHQDDYNPYDNSSAHISGGGGGGNSLSAYANRYSMGGGGGGAGGDSSNAQQSYSEDRWASSPNGAQVLTAAANGGGGGRSIVGGGGGGGSLASVLEQRGGGPVTHPVSSRVGAGARANIPHESPFATEKTAAQVSLEYNEADRVLTRLMTEKSQLQDESEKLLIRGLKTLRDRTRSQQVDMRLGELSKEIATLRRILSGKPA